MRSHLDPNHCPECSKTALRSNAEKPAHQCMPRGKDGGRGRSRSTSKTKQNKARQNQSKPSHPVAAKTSREKRVWPLITVGINAQKQLSSSHENDPQSKTCLCADSERTAFAQVDGGIPCTDKKEDTSPVSASSFPDACCSSPDVASDVFTNAGHKATT